MEEKKYPVFYEDKQDGVMVGEPNGTANYSSTSHPVIGTNHEERADKAQPLIGPATYEDAILRIKKGEREIAKGDVYDWEDVKRELTSKIFNYAS